ncbi:MAG: YDG domain-containing protein, partial [Candidatus Paceibacterota bacterium]
MRIKNLFKAENKIPKILKYFIAGILSIILALIVLPQNTFAAARTASVTGDWNSTVTWGGSSVPGVADSVTINSGIIVTVPSGYSAFCTTINFTTGTVGVAAINLADAASSLTASGAVSIQRPRSGGVSNTINVDGGTFSAPSVALLSSTGTTRVSRILISTGTATISGNITSAGIASQIIFSSAGTINAGGTFMSGTRGTFTPSTGTVNFNALGNQTVNPFTYTFYNLTTSGSGTKTTGAILAVGGNLTVNSGTTFATGVTNSWTLNVTGTTTVSGTITLANTGNKTFSGDLTINSGGVWNETSVSAITINGNIVNNATTFTANTGSHTFSGSNKTFSGTTAIVIPGTAIFAGGAYTNNGTFSASTLNALIAGATYTNNGTTTVSTALSGSSGVFTQGSTGVLNFGGSTIAIATFSASATGNVVNYTGGAQTIRSVPYYDLALSGSNTKTMTGVTTIAGDFSLNGTVSATAASGLTIGGNISIGSGTTFNGGTALTHNVAGNWSNSGIFTANTSTINFNGANQSINNANTWYDLSITGTSARTVTLQSGVLQTVSNSLTLSGASGQLLTLVPSAIPIKWQISAPLTQSVMYVSPSYSDASSGTAVNATSITNVDGGNNINWNFYSNPLPTTTSISPTSKTVGDAGFSLTVNGTNFVSNSIVNFNGSPRTTYYVSPTELSGDILNTDLNTVGTSSITVFNPTPGGGLSNSQMFTVNAINTTTGLTTSSSTSQYGTSVIFSATVTPASGGAPSGTVTFKDGGSTIGTGVLNGANPGVATLSTSTLSVIGSPHSITAVYVGDTTHSESTSTPVSQTITAKNLTVSGITASNKPYDQGTSATLSGTPGSLVGIVNSDDVSLTGTAVGNFLDKNVGNNKTVNVSGQSLAGTSASNYALIEPTTTANINAINLTVNGITANDKVYDGTASSTLNLGGANLVGVISGDSVNLNTSLAVGTFDDPNVGTGKTVTISGLYITGADYLNYNLIQPTTTASITNPLPTTTSISPTSKNVGDLGFTMHVYGTNFVNGSTVSFN